MFGLWYVPLKEQRTERLADENLAVGLLQQLGDLIEEVADADLELISERLQPFSIWIEAGLLPVHRARAVDAHLFGELVHRLKPPSYAESFDLSPDPKVAHVAPIGGEVSVGRNMALPGASFFVAQYAT